MTKSIRQILPKLLRPEFSFPFIVLVGLLLYYFYPLFYPHPQLFYTADYGLSDIWHFHYPVKHLLATALKTGHLPFWTPLIGGGLPIFAEGQIGALYPPNLILFALLPTWLAWNLSFPLTITIAFTGTYLFLRLLERSIFASTFAAFIFSFSSFFVLHFVHLTLIQSACLLPFAFWGYHRFFHQTSLKNLLLAAIPLALQIYAGYFQIFVITCIALGTYFFALFLTSRKNYLFLISLLLPGIFALLISAPQLLPTIELSRLSSLREGSPQALRFPFHLKTLITFIFPNYFGTPALGTIPSNFDSGIYWENVNYLGLIPLGLSLLSLVKLRTRGLLPVILLLLVSVLFALGQATPFGLFYHLPVLNIFRVSARFLLASVFSLIVLSAFALDYLIPRFSSPMKRYFFFLTIFAFSLIDLFGFHRDYHPLVSLDEALAPPEMSRLLEPNRRLFVNHQVSQPWNEQFLTQGWQDVSPYLFFKNSLDANLSSIWQHSNLGEYTGVRPERLEIFLNLNAPHLIDTAAVDYLIHYVPSLSDPSLRLVDTINPPNSLEVSSLYLFENTDALPRFRLATTSIILANQQEVIDFLATDPDLSGQVVLESGTPLETATGSGQVSLVHETDHTLSLQTSTTAPSYLIIADSYYPNWHATLDSKPVEVLPANLNQRAIYLPPGDHQVTFNFVPTSFYLGLLVFVITLLTLTLWKLFSHRLSPDWLTLLDDFRSKTS